MHTKLTISTLPIALSAVLLGCADDSDPDATVGHDLLTQPSAFTRDAGAGAGRVAVPDASGCGAGSSADAGAHDAGGFDAGPSIDAGVFVDAAVDAGLPRLDAGAAGDAGCDAGTCSLPPLPPRGQARWDSAYGGVDGGPGVAASHLGSATLERVSGSEFKVVLTATSPADGNSVQLDIVVPAGTGAASSSLGVGIDYASRWNLLLVPEVHPTARWAAGATRLRSVGGGEAAGDFAIADTYGFSGRAHGTFWAVCAPGLCP